MKWFPSQIVDILFGFEKGLSTESLRNLVVSDNRFSGLPIDDLEKLYHFINAENKLFFDWIKLQTDVEKLLAGNIPLKIFEDSFNWQKHSLFEKFQEFFSVFFVESWSEIKTLTLNNQERCRILSFFNLLPENQHLVYEQQLFGPIEHTIKAKLINQSALNLESELLMLTDEICNSDIISCLNQLSKASYALKINYVDNILKLADHPACSARLLYRIVQQLKTLNINPEHQQSIFNIEQNLKKGKLLSPKSKKITWKSLVLPLGLTLLFVMIYTFIKLFDNQHEKIDTTLFQQSSLEFFTVEERKQIDSLLKTKTKKQSFVHLKDQYLWTQTPVNLVLRESLKNKRMERLYNDWLLDAEIKSMFGDSCEKKNNKSTFPGIKELKQLSGNKALWIKNDSDYEVYCFVFDNEKNGSIYAEIISKKSQLKLKVNQGQYFLFVAGNEISSYNRLKNTGNIDQPSSTFNHHFCRTDENLLESLANIYQFRFPLEKDNKLLLVGDQSSVFSVVDLNGILSVE